MEIQILEPLRLYLKNDEVESAVELLLKPSSEKKVGDSSDWLDQSDFRHAWLAAHEIYAAMHEQASLVWKRLWMDNPNWVATGLVPLSLAEMRESEFDEPSMVNAWDYGWFGWAFRTKGDEHVGLYVYCQREKVYLNIWYPELLVSPEGWEQDSDEDAEKNTVHDCRWGETSIDVTHLADAATSMLQALAGR